MALEAPFIESLLISKKPYKLIYVATGNITNKQLLDLFSRNIKTIVSFANKNRLIEITDKSIIGRF